MMSQQNFPQKTPTMQVNESQAIPAAVVHAQTRDGKDEAITGAGLMLRDGGPGTDFTEVSEANPIPVKATLTGSKASGYESLTVGTSAVGLTPAQYGMATRAQITIEAAALRYRIDGSNPTASQGHLAYPDDVIELASANDIARFRAIRTTGTSATIRVTYSGGA